MKSDDATDFDELVAGVEIRCDFNSNENFGGLGESLCSNKVEWYFIYHGCNRELLCEEHGLWFLNELVAVLQHYGSVICSQCEKKFETPFDYLRVRKL